MKYQKTNPLHLYRSLLREVTYLHDVFSRQYLKAYIGYRFDSYRDVEDPEKLSNLLKFGRRQHSLLIRANAGEKAAGLRVLRTTYGRIGKRSHEILKPFLTDELGEPLDPKDPKTRPPIITSRLKQFLSQTPQNQLAKKATLEIPEMVNGKKFNQRRACNMLWDAYGEVISKAIPPSPEAEFERLEMLARGDLDEPPPPRRPRPNTPEAEEDEGQRNIGRVISKINLHWLTAAHRRRLYRTLLIECPKFVELPATETQGSKWKVVYSPLRGSQEATVGELEEFPS